MIDEHELEKLFFFTVNSLGDTGAKNLSEALKTHCSLFVLDISCEKKVIKISMHQRSCHPLCYEHITILAMKELK